MPVETRSMAHRKRLIVIYVRTLTSQRFMRLEVSAAESVARVKQMIAEVNGVPVELQGLRWGGQVLENEQNLADYGVVDEALLCLVVRLVGS